MLWKLRDQYFTGPGEIEFKFQPDNEPEITFPVSVDKNGYFKSTKSFPFGVFARLVGD